MSEVQILSPRPRNAPEFPGLARAARRLVVGEIGVLQHGCSKRAERDGSGEGIGVGRHRIRRARGYCAGGLVGGGLRLEGEAINRAAEVAGGEVAIDLGRYARVHARYTRVEILAAFGVGEAAKVAPWQTGVYWAKEAKADLLAFTLDKTSGQFSPTTRYRDYAISRELIHWESQSVTRADSDAGLRYQRHAQLGSGVMLFARLRADDRAFAFLGPAAYVKHESELPMAVTWRLQHRLPGDLFASFAAAVA